MPYFNYRGVDPLGKPAVGTEFGNSIRDAADRLSLRGISIIDISEERKSFLWFNFADYFASVSRNDMKCFYVNLATLINAGCTLRASLSALAEQAENHYFARTLAKVNSDIEAGSSFSEALSHHPKVFSDLFVHFVRAGEEGGILDDILLRYAAYEENQEKIREKVRGAMILPALMVVVAVSVVIALLIYVFPKFMELFKGRENLLPSPTRLVIALSDFIRYQSYTLIGYVVAFVFLLKLVMSTNIGYRIFSILQLRVPLFGDLFRKMYVSRFARTLAALTKGGVPTLRSLKITIDIIPNYVLKDAIFEIYMNIERGGNYVDPMRRYKTLFPSMVTLMVSVGEATGKIDEMLDKVSDFYDGEVEVSIAAIISMIEPVLTVMMGGVVLVIALSMFLPLFDVGKILR